MMPQTNAQGSGELQFPVAELENAAGASPVLLICEHASNRIPSGFDDLGLSPAVRSSHIAWDPGALSVARHLSAIMDARLATSTVSRLVYDCNRPPEAMNAIPVRSERFDVPGNAGLNDADRAARARDYYQPFRDLLADAIIGSPIVKAIVTIHSFTPVYLGVQRDVEIGILHSTDKRLADRMLSTASGHTDLVVRRNEPYGARDGVMHTLDVHAVGIGLLNVMLEIRNDLIKSADQQRSIAEMLAGWLQVALRAPGEAVEGEVSSCRA